MKVDLELVDGSQHYQRVILDTMLHARSNVWIATANVKDWQIDTQDPRLIEHVARLFHEIWEGLLCPECGRTNVCYVPLEQPAREGRRV